MNIDTLASPAASTSDATVHAARFTIGDIIVVRLVPTKLLHVTETVLETVGLTPATTRQVGRTAATQPMGFIDWVAIHRPDDLTVALPYLGELSRAQGAVASKPTRVKNQMKPVIAKLEEEAPHCVPAFITELARHFVMAGRTGFLTHYLKQIIAVISQSDLPIDSPEYQELLFEFASWRAMTTRVLRDEVDTAERSLEPQAAFDYAYKLIVAQAQAGGILDKSAVIILRRLGKPLGLKPDDIFDRLLADIIYSKGFTAADPEFFTRVEPSLRRIVRADRGRQDRLLAVRPVYMSLEFYHDLLVDTEAWRELTSDNRAFAYWICQLITAPGGIYTEKWLIDAIYQAKDALAGTVLPAKKPQFRHISSPDLINALADAGVTWEKPDDLQWHWYDWCDNHYTDLAGVAADPYLRAMAIREAIRELSIGSIVRNIQLFLDNEPAREMAAEFLDQVYENRREYLFSCGDWLRYQCGDWLRYQCGDWLRYQISNLAHPELWLINAQAMNRFFAFDPVVELAAYIEVSEYEAAKLLGDMNYAYSCGPDIAQAVVETWKIEQLFAENRALVRGSAVGYIEREGHWGTIIRNIIKNIEIQSGGGTASTFAPWLFPRTRLAPPRTRTGTPPK